jgi:hypothetical protein
MKPKLQIGLMLLCLVGATVSAAPTKIEDRHEYSTSLNSIASIVMNWYGSLIVTDDLSSKKINERVYFNTTNIGDQWLQYRSQYPQNITQVLITHTQLLRSNNDYLFNVHSTISYKNPDNKILTQSLKETFLFSGDFINGSSPVSSPIKNISLVKRAEISPLETTEYNREHYKVREFVYAWLAYIDDLDTLTPVMNGDEWLNQATYSLEIGANKTRGSVEEILKQRKQTLAKGGHLLSTLDVVIPENSNDAFILDFILEWKGVNDKGKPVLAKIHQELKVQIKDDKSWIVISIKEKHLLPIIAPWMGLLC